MKMDPSYPLLPDDDELSLWQYCLKTAIISIQKNAKPYERGSHSGVTEHLYYQGERVGYAKGFSYCCGATYEAFIKAWKEWATEEEDENMNIEQAKEMRAHFFVYGDKDEYGNFKYALGAPGGLLWLAKQPGLEWLKVEYLDDPNLIIINYFYDEWQPYSCASWGSAGDNRLPIMINDGVFNNMDNGNDGFDILFYNSDAGVPKYIFINKDMELHYTYNSYMNEVQVKTKIDEMLDEF